MYTRKTITKEQFNKLVKDGVIYRQGNQFFCDAAFTFRMGAGQPGDITRIEAATVEPCLIDANSPPTLYGQPVVLDVTTQGVRPIGAGDGALTNVYGFTVRPFPTQQQSTNNFGATTLAGANVPPTSGIIDVLRSGYILTTLSNPAVQPIKGSTIDVWFAASAGNHVQGSVEAAHTGGSSFTIAGAGTSVFNGAADASNIAEIAFNI